MVILQSHRTQNMILRCYPNVSAILWTNLVSCAFSTIPIFLLFKGVQHDFLNTPQNISFKSISYADQCGIKYKLLVLKFELSPV